MGGSMKGKIILTLMIALSISLFGISCGGGGGGGGGITTTVPTQPIRCL